MKWFYDIPWLELWPYLEYAIYLSDDVMYILLDKLIQSTKNSDVDDPMSMLF